MADVARYLQQMDIFQEQLQTYDEQVQALNSADEVALQTATNSANTVDSIRNAATLVVGGTVATAAVKQGALSAIKSGAGALMDKLSSGTAEVADEVATENMAIAASSELTEPLLADYAEDEIAMEALDSTAYAEAGVVEETAIDATIGLTEVPLAAEAIGETVGLEAAEIVGETAAAETVGAALDSTGILAPIGLLIGALAPIISWAHHKKARPNLPSSGTDLGPAPKRPNLSVPVASSGVADY